MKLSLLLSLLPLIKPNLMILVSPLSWNTAKVAVQPRILATRTGCSSNSSSRRSVQLRRNTNDNTYNNDDDDDDIRTNSMEEDDPEMASLYPGILDREAHVLLLDRSLRQLTGRGIMDRVVVLSDIFEILTSCRYALYSHGVLKASMIDGAVHNFANFGALSMFGVTYKQFVQFPCSRIAPPGFHQEQLSQALQHLEEKEQGVMEDYTGLRSRLDTQQDTFRVKDAVIWNIYDNEGNYNGQATLIDRDSITINNSIAA